MTLRSKWLSSAAVLGCAVVIGCAQEPPRRPLNYGTSGNRPPQAMAAREPLYEPSLGFGTISGSAGTATTRPIPTGAELPMSPAVGASGAPVTPGTPGPAAPGAGEVAVPPPADAGAAPPAAGTGPAEGAAATPPAEGTTPAPAPAPGGPASTNP
jgi:hypothetical protein